MNIQYSAFALLVLQIIPQKRHSEYFTLAAFQHKVHVNALKC